MVTPSHLSHTQVPFSLAPALGLSVLPCFCVAGDAGPWWAQPPRTHLRLHQVDSLCPELTHAVEDVDHPFILSHVEHGVNSDEAAGPPSSSTGREGTGCGEGSWGGASCGWPQPFGPTSRALLRGRMLQTAERWEPQTLLRDAEQATNLRASALSFICCQSHACPWGHFIRVTYFVVSI